MIPMNRRGVLSTGAALMMSGGAGLAAQNGQAPGGKDYSLKTAAPFRVGTCFSSPQFGQPDLVRLLTRNFSQVTPEWQMKMDALQKADGSIDLKDCEGFIRQAADNGVQVHGHALIWYLQRAPYFASLNGSRPRFEAAFAKYIASVAGPLSGKIRGWDVVNECIAEDGSGYRDCLWTDNLTISYVGLAFQHAKAADKKAVLFLNDYNLESNPRKRRQFLVLAESLLKQGIPLEGLGSQTHIHTDLAPGAVRACIQDLASLGLPIHISEFDVSTPKTVAVMTPAIQVQRERLVVETVEAFESLPVNQRYAFTTWGLRDSDSFTNHNQRPGAPVQSPVFFDDAGNPNANMKAFIGAIHR
jgi:endo-1,4-beta-xylanase